jgi:hypothetical protein
VDFRPHHDAAQGGVQDEALQGGRPPAAFQLTETWVLESPRELSALRSAIAGAITGDGTGSPRELDQVADNMVLIASELATNALRHGFPPTVVRLLRRGATFLLDVEDHDQAGRPYLAGERPAGDGGLGLQIAKRLALDVGWYISDTGKHVWAVLLGDPAGPEAGDGLP